jgi:hypothetical protein
LVENAQAYPVKSLVLTLASSLAEDRPSTVLRGRATTLRARNYERRFEGIFGERRTLISSLLMARRMDGAEVYIADGENIGHFEDLHQKITSKVIYAIVTFGGFFVMLTPCRSAAKKSNGRLQCSELAGCDIDSEKSYSGTCASRRDTILVMAPLEELAEIVAKTIATVNMLSAERGARALQGKVADVPRNHPRQANRRKSPNGVVVPAGPASVPLTGNWACWGGHSSRPNQELALGTCVNSSTRPLQPFDKMSKTALASGSITISARRCVGAANSLQSRALSVAGSDAMRLVTAYPFCH